MLLQGERAMVKKEPVHAGLTLSSYRIYFIRCKLQFDLSALFAVDDIVCCVVFRLYIQVQLLDGGCTVSQCYPLLGYLCCQICSQDLLTCKLHIYILYGFLLLSLRLRSALLRLCLYFCLLLSLRCLSLYSLCFYLCLRCFFYGLFYSCLNCRSCCLCLYCLYCLCCLYRSVYLYVFCLFRCLCCFLSLL